MDEGTFTGAGVDALVPRPATDHVASGWTPPPRRSWWQATLAFLGLGD